jgi:hypothetical protein
MLRNERWDDDKCDNIYSLKRYQGGEKEVDSTQVHIVDVAQHPELDNRYITKYVRGVHVDLLGRICSLSNID